MRLAHLVVQPTARFATRVLRSIRPYSRPLVSVIVPVYNVEAYLPACLDSILSQDVELEVIVVDDGSTDGSARVIAEYAARDRRIRPYRQRNAGQGSARNRGVSHARGEFLAFVDSDDLVPAGALRSMLGPMRASGSDFVIGGVRRLEDGAYYRPSWSVVVHERDRIGISIDEFPAALADVVAHHRLFRRRFWVDRVGGFPRGIYEDHVPMVAAYLRARRFDVITRPTYDWRIREDRTSTGQQKHEHRNLTERIRVKAEARALVWREASAPVRAAWVGRVLDIDFPPYIDHALRSDDAYRATLRDALATYAGLATPEAWSYVRVQQKVRTCLAARGAWDQLEAAQQLFAELGSIPPTDVQDDAVVLAPGVAAALGTDLPGEVLQLGRGESRMQVCLVHADWTDPARLELVGWAVIRAVDLTSRTPSLQLALLSDDGSRRVELPVEPLALAEATRWVNWPHGSFDRAGFRTLVDATQMTAGGIPAAWRLQARLELDGLVREVGVHHSVAGSSADRSALAALRPRTTAWSAIPRYDREHGFTIAFRESADRAAVGEQPAAELLVTDVEVDGDRIRVTAEARNAEVAAAVRLSDGMLEVEPLSIGAPNAGSVEIVFPTVTPGETRRALPSGDWSLAVLDTVPATEVHAAPDLAANLPRDFLTPSHRVRLALAGARRLRLKFGPRLTDQELGSRAQWVLREAYRRDERSAADEILVLPSLSTESLPQLTRALEERRPDLVRSWSVPDLASTVPAGTDPILIGTRAWYAHLASARFLLDGDDLEPWFRKRAFQRIVRIFGDASAPVGRSPWWDAGWTPGRIEAEVARRISTWDAIVVPDASSVERCRRDLDWTGPVLVAGTDPIERIIDALLGEHR